MCVLISATAMGQTKVDAACRAKYAKLYFTDSLGTVLPYRLLTPEKKEGDSLSKYPVLLFLHGAGERGSDNEIQLTYIDTVFAAERFRREHPCYVIVPQCALEYRWCETDWSRTYHTMPRYISKYLHAANSLLDSVAALPDADPKRLYVTGMSMGGYGTWDIITRYPNKFAAAMPICGGADEKEARRLVNIPIRTFHGSVDKAVPVVRSRNIANAIRSQGGKKIEYTEFPKMGHFIWNKVYNDYSNLEWLFSN
ncbi:MAG: dienelactone hydrolase family protein [Bacteroidales bacterium]|nr:dienelactone hydrolase family protein [Bacteroidales bacterium]